LAGTLSAPKRKNLLPKKTTAASTTSTGIVAKLTELRYPGRTRSGHKIHACPEPDKEELTAEQKKKLTQLFLTSYIG
jgi:hypothetical protein